MYYSGGTKWGGGVAAKAASTSKKRTREGVFQEQVFKDKNGESVLEGAGKPWLVILAK